MTRHNGTHDFQLGELKNTRVHSYDTKAHADADSSTANGRICYVVDTNRFYLGRSNVWIELGEESDPAPVIVSKTSNATLVSSAVLYVLLNSSGGQFTLTLPATASAYDQIIIKDLGAALVAHPVLLNPGSQTLDGLSSSLEMNRPYQCVVMQYINSAWVVISDA